MGAEASSARSGHLDVRKGVCLGIKRLDMERERERERDRQRKASSGIRLRGIGCDGT